MMDCESSCRPLSWTWSWSPPSAVFRACSLLFCSTDTQLKGRDEHKPLGNVTFHYSLVSSETAGKPYLQNITHFTACAVHVFLMLSQLHFYFLSFISNKDTYWVTSAALWASLLQNVFISLWPHTKSKNLWREPVFDGKAGDMQTPPSKPHQSTFRSLTTDVPHRYSWDQWVLPLLPCGVHLFWDIKGEHFPWKSHFNKGRYDLYCPDGWQAC